jgi:hypothetical protein
MDFAHPHKVGKTLGVTHEENPKLHPLSLVRASIPPVRSSQYLLDPAGPFFRLTALMQSFSPECGGFSLAQLVNFIAVLKKGAAPTELSGSFSYAYEKTVDGYPHDDGTTISAIGLAGSRVASCLKTLFPDDGDPALNPTGEKISPWADATPQAITDAVTRLLGSPFLLDDLSIEGIHQACFENSAVILELQLGNEWYTSTSGEETWDAAEILPIRPPAKVIDSHFVLVAPYDEPNDRTWFINSSSPQWAQNGFGYFGWNYAPFIKSGIAFKAIPPSVSAVIQNPAVPPETKPALIQQILTDIEAAIALIQKEL